MNKLVVPMPCKHTDEITLKDWLAKLDEEVNEFKAELLKYFSLDDKLEPIGMKYEDRDNIADEGADVCTVVTSIQDLISIYQDDRMKGQLRVNRHNKERGRL